jgi:hypothetical protein
MTELIFRLPKTTYAQHLRSAQELSRSERAMLDAHKLWCEENSQEQQDLCDMINKTVALRKARNTFGSGPWPAGSLFLITDVWNGKLHGVAPVESVVGRHPDAISAPVLLNADWVRLRKAAHRILGGA